jgi:3-methylcrotonyl-CoA carboxylase alpha subunit
VSQGQLRQQYPASDQAFDYRVRAEGETVRVNLDGLDGPEIELAVTTRDAKEGWCRTSDGNPHSFFWTWTGSSLQLWVDGNLYIFEKVESRRQASRGPSGHGGDIVAPMPGRVEQILVQPGDSVERGQTVIIMESMKMELEIAAQRDGVVKQVPVERGDQVDKGTRLVELEDR